MSPGGIFSNVKKTPKLHFCISSGSQANVNNRRCNTFYVRDGIYFVGQDLPWSECIDTMKISQILSQLDII